MHVRHQPERSDWTLTHHARTRAAERDISEDEILDVVMTPEVRYTQTTHGPDREVRQRGHLGVVVNPKTLTVITVVFRHFEDWERQLRTCA